MRVLVAALLLSGCLPPSAEDGDPDSRTFGADEDGGTSAPLAVGGLARVTADALNLRDAAGTQANILLTMPCGAQVEVLDGPSNNWWNLRYQNETGWASGKYLIPDGIFSDALCNGGAPAGGGTVVGGTDVDAMFARAKLALGYSYYWGHGSWRGDGAATGSCLGSCPDCTHGGAYGADCSGFVAKVWQVPSPSALEADAHPYSTSDFYSATDHWKPVPRSMLQPGDALVHRSGSSGHIALVEAPPDSSGQIWVYEARGCATGVVHDLRTFDSSYIAIRRDAALP